jgi:Bacterial pre-peptidase C-terminal domain
MVRIVAALLAAFAVAPPANAQTCFPMITHCTPVAVQRGTTAEIVVEGQQSFAGATGWLADNPGLTVEIVPPAAKAAKANSVTLKVSASKDVPLGPHEFRVVTRHGPSTIGQLLVVDDPVVQERGNNNTIAGANSLPVPGVACGRIDGAEDVDFYRFHATAGTSYTFEVWGARLQDKIHDLQKHLDPLITIFDSTGRELAGNDDYFFADPYLVWTAPSTGDFFVQIRDAKYDGDSRWAYALCVTDKPYAAHIFPFAGQPGQTITVEPVGTAAKVAAKVTVQLPTAPGLHRLPLLTPGGPTNPVAFFVSPLPQIVEHEPNDTPAQAQTLPIPCGVSGRMDKPRDIDYFRFQGEKGKAIRFEVRARRFGTPLQSRLDSVLEILSPKGQLLAANDDDPNTGKDSVLTFTPPADAEYQLRIRDLNSKGGPGYVYYFEADFARPDFTLRCDSDLAMIAPGSHTGWYVHVVRINGFAGPVTVAVTGLPPGVTASPLVIPPTMTQGLLVLSAAKDAQIGAASNVQVVGTASRAKQPPGDLLTRTAVPNAEIYLPGGGRGKFDVTMQSVAVTEAGDILNVTVTPSVVQLKPGAEVKLDVTIERRKDFNQDVTLDVPLRHLGQTFGNPLPPGVTVLDDKSKTRLRAGETKGHIVLIVAGDAAPIENVPIAVTAYVSVNFVVKIGYSSTPIPLTIAR